MRRRPEDWRRDLSQALRPVTRPNVGVVMWRWRYEAAAVLTPVAAFVVDRWLGAAVATSALLLCGLALVLSPALRRRAVARVRCVAVQHRLRVAFVEAGLYSSQGRLPFILRTSPVPAGERVLLWLPAGITQHDVLACRHRLASTCWARDVEVHRHERYAQIVELVVLRDAPRQEAS